MAQVGQHVGREGFDFQGNGRRLLEGEDDHRGRQSGELHAGADALRLHRVVVERYRVVLLEQGRRYSSIFSS